MKRLVLSICLIVFCTAGGRTKERPSRNPGLGRVLALTFDEGAGAKDWSNYGNDGTPTGAAFTFDATQGGVYDFDGTNDSISAGSAASLDDITVKTISVWINITVDDDSHQGLVSKYNGLTAGWSLYRVHAIPVADDDTIAYAQRFSGDDGIWHIPKNSILFNQWYHVAIVYDNSAVGNNPAMYLNGVSQSVTEFGTPTGTRDSDASLNMVIADGPGKTFGMIDDVFVYKRALSELEIKELYQEGLAKRP